MEKFGTVLMWDEMEERGEIEDENGNLYEFVKDNCDFTPEEGDEVEFIVEEDEVDSVWRA